MMAGPSSPGVGAPVYQPAGKPEGGTSSEPSDVRPRSIKLLSTPIDGTWTRTGTERPIGGASMIGVGGDSETTDGGMDITGSSSDETGAAAGETTAVAWVATPAFFADEPPPHAVTLRATTAAMTATRALVVRLTGEPTGTRKRRRSCCRPRCARNRWAPG